MWGFSPEALARIRAGLPADDPETVAKKEAEQKIEKIGKGECDYCNEDIVKNEPLNNWESESLVAYCPDARDHKHKPKVGG